YGRLAPAKVMEPSGLATLIELSLMLVTTTRASFSGMVLLEVSVTLAVSTPVAKVALPVSERRSLGPYGWAAVRAFPAVAARSGWKVLRPPCTSTEAPKLAAPPSAGLF